MPARRATGVAATTSELLPAVGTELEPSPSPSPLVEGTEGSASLTGDLRQEAVAEGEDEVQEPVEVTDSTERGVFGGVSSVFSDVTEILQDTVDAVGDAVEATGLDDVVDNAMDEVGDVLEE